MPRLPFHAHRADGTHFDIEFELHPQTGTVDHVGALAGAILEAIAARVDALGTVSDGDVLQALAVATAVRAEVTNAPRADIDAAARVFLEAALSDAHGATYGQSGRA